MVCIDTSPHEMPPDTPEIEGYSEYEVRYHIALMGEAGLLDVSSCKSMSDTLPQAMLHSITWAGHDFADAAKSPDIWEKGKGIAQSVGGVGIDVMKSILQAVAKDQIKKRFGIEI